MILFLPDDILYHIRLFHSLTGFLHNALGQIFDLLGTGSALLRQFADLFRHHGKASARLSGSGGLDGGIQT